ncbi:MAG: low molecular weight phosphotyrosine protein phosphatase [Cyclobacteriaceae bacterium]|jgi:protein-tyrosine phosphatase|nr:low molecular weight phosphotyrosine protein phosphatase [Cyclobacteriaceae bacterium]
MYKTKVLFVCLGNICRSPLAEAVFKHKVKQHKLENDFYIDSCGTANYHVGDTPDARTIANAKKNGIEINHIGRQFSVADFEIFDHIFVMDNQNLRNVLRLTSNTEFHSKVKLFRTVDFTDNETEVPDPYYGTEKDFQNVFEIVDKTASALLLHLTR